MKNKRVVFTNPGQFEIQQSDFELTPQDQREVVIKTHFSLISAGTELACLSGSESWFKFPSTPGYTSVGEVVAVGQAVTHLAVGDLVYSWGGHSAYNRVGLDQPRTFCPKAPEGNSEELVPFPPLATITKTSI